MGYNIDEDTDEKVAASPSNALGENVAPSRIQRGLELKSKYRIRSSAQITSCSTCHR
jgi:hypothetical protein